MDIIETVDLLHEGTALVGYLALPGGQGPHRAVLVMPNAQGLGEHVKATARRLAAAGYVALGGDMLGGGKCYAKPEEVGPIVGPLMENPVLARARVQAWLRLLQARPEVDASRIGAIGFCYGGQNVLELARAGEDLKVVVSYHGLLHTHAPAPAGGIKAKVVIYTGARDPYVPRAAVAAFEDEMRAAAASWQITVFGDAGHAFTDVHALELGLEGLGYDPLADRLSWSGTEILLESLV